MHFQRKKLVIQIAKMQQILFFVHQLMMNVNCPIGNLSLRKCTVCSSIDLTGFELDSSNQAPRMTFNIYINQFTFSHHGILIRKKSPLIWMQKEHLKILVSYVNN